jgi:hypothetical protein
VERATRAGAIVLAAAWAAYATSLSIQIWSDHCPFAPNRCDFGPVDDGFAAMLVAVALGGAWLAVRGRWSWAAAVLAFWVIVPFLLLWTSQQ